MKDGPEEGAADDVGFDEIVGMEEGDDDGLDESVGATEGTEDVVGTGVADFFFVTCKGICIPMSNNMLKLQEAFRQGWT